MREHVHGILLLYYHPIQINASTIMEHINSFRLYSQYPVIQFNLLYDLPKILERYSFSVIVLHYSLFDWFPFKVQGKFLNYLLESKMSSKIAFFQDEYIYCRERRAAIDQLGIKCIFTLVEEPFHDRVYGSTTHADQIIYSIPGYVSEDLERIGETFLLPDDMRTVDIGYRGRELPAYDGKGGLEKVEIARRFLEYSYPYNLVCDIETNEGKRIYGDDWYRFVANCKGMLGVEAGVSIFDLNGDVYRVYQELMKGKSKPISYEELEEKINLSDYEDEIYYRTISPRHFEAAALRVCQILYEGKYSGILQPWIHYIPLKKDFSNFSEVITAFMNPECRQEIVDNAYRDLILSKKYTYSNYISEFDRVIRDSRYMPEEGWADLSYISEEIGREMKWLRMRYRSRHSVLLMLSVVITLIGKFPRVRLALLKIRSLVR